MQYVWSMITLVWIQGMAFFFFLGFAKSTFRLKHSVCKVKIIVEPCFCKFCEHWVYYSYIVACPIVVLSPKVTAETIWEGLISLIYLTGHTLRPPYCHTCAHFTTAYTVPRTSVCKFPHHKNIWCRGLYGFLKYIVQLHNINLWINVSYTPPLTSTGKGNSMLSSVSSVKDVVM